MKRKSFRYQVMASPTPFVRPMADPQPNLDRNSSATGERRTQMRKIFVIKQVPASKTGGRKIQRILVFDNHPESLRLVLGPGATPFGDLFDRQHRSSWGLVTVWALTLIALIGMFWPLL